MNDILENLLSSTVIKVFMLRFVKPNGESNNSDGPLILRTDVGEFLIGNKNEGLYISESNWEDPFSLDYVLGNPVYPEDIMELRDQIGEYCIYDLSNNPKFQHLSGKMINDIELLRNEVANPAGMSIILGAQKLTLLVQGDFCVVNPITLPPNFYPVEVTG